MIEGLYHLTAQLMISQVSSSNEDIPSCLIVNAERSDRELIFDAVEDRLKIVFVDEADDSQKVVEIDVHTSLPVEHHLQYFSDDSRSLNFVVCQLNDSISTANLDGFSKDSSDDMSIDRAGCALVWYVRGSLEMVSHDLERHVIGRDEGDVSRLIVELVGLFLLCLHRSSWSRCRRRGHRAYDRAYDRAYEQWERVFVSEK